MSKHIAILGSTGSIGTNALRVIEGLGPGYEVYALTAHSKVELLAEQVLKFRPKIAAITDEGRYEELKRSVGDTDVEILAGAESLVDIASHAGVDTVLTAVVGAAGLPAVLAGAKAGKRLAIANKEPLVVAGELLMAAAKEGGAEVLPVDSEHSAIFQALQAGVAGDVGKIILTASGGPFRGKDWASMEDVTVEEALAHPVWEMGAKITIDSATMMNKALEVIEARWLFDTPVEHIEVLIHPQSIVHSLVEYVDGSVIAQLGTPDMCVPIQYALTYPRRMAGISKRLRLDELGTLTFEKPDMDVFRLLKLGFEVAGMGGTSAAVFNAANESAVAAFLAKKIRFTGIVELIERCLDEHECLAGAELEELVSADAWARQWVECESERDSRVRLG